MVKLEIEHQFPGTIDKVGEPDGVGYDFHMI